MNSSTNSGMSTTSTLLAGMAMGAGAMLLANKSMREKVMDKVDSLKEMTSDNISDATKAAKQKARKIGRVATNKIDETTS